MRILVDENIPKITTQRLSEEGWDVADIRQTENQGMKDESFGKKLKMSNGFLLPRTKVLRPSEMTIISAWSSCDSNSQVGTKFTRGSCKPFENSRPIDGKVLWL